MAITDQIKELIEPTIEDLGLTLWGVEYLNSKTPLLRIYIDKEDGVTIEDCTDVSHAVSSILDVEDPIESEYNLEVSSPGAYRPFFTLEQMAGFIGENITVHLRMPQNARRKWFGKLLEVDENSFTLDTSVVKEKRKPTKTKTKGKKVEETTSVSTEHDPIKKFLFSNVNKANLEPEF